MKHCKVFFLFCFIIGCTVPAMNAQTNFKPGFIITLKSDTIYGEIDSRGPVINALSCSFRKNNQSVPEYFGPKDIEAYRFIGGKYYISHDIPDSSLKQKRVFLEFLLHGIVDLYYYKSDDELRYFIQKAGGPFLELSNDEVVHHVSSVNGESTYSIGNMRDNSSSAGEYVSTSNQYIGILKATFADCKMISHQVDAAQLSARSLIRVTRAYHDYTCDSFKCIQYEKDMQTKWHFAPALRFVYSGFRFAFYDTKSFPMYLHTGVGFMAECQPLFNSDKYSFLIESYVIKNTYSENHKNAASPNGYDYIYTFNNIASESFFSVKYIYPKGNWKPIATGGVIIYYAPTEKMNITEANIINQTFSQYEDDHFSRFMVGLSLGGGISWIASKSLAPFMLLRMERYAEMDVGGEVTAYSLQLGVSF